MSSGGLTYVGQEQKEGEDDHIYVASPDNVCPVDLGRYSRLASVVRECTARTYDYSVRNDRQHHVRKYLCEPVAQADCVVIYKGGIWSARVVRERRDGTREIYSKILPSLLINFREKST